ncbi:alpha/beta fold hydrolase [Corynebacterium nuruki]|uniref:alpha/beta fold hydrolase n=1 Tax=Corynebacterium nuruki TaxID=1032851 RepID=UPI0039BEE16F
MSAVPGAVTADDITEFTRTFARPDGWRGAVGLYRSMLAEGDEIREIVASSPLRVPTLAIGGSGGPFTETTLDRVTDGPVDSVLLDNVGHHVPLEAPEAFAMALLTFIDGVDNDRSTD